MNNPLISQLTKTQILSLPGFQNKGKKTKTELRNELNRNINRMRLAKRGLRINDYINAFKKDDDKLFKKMKKQKRDNQKTKQSREQYKQTIKDNARSERDILNMPLDLYSTAKTEARQEYKNRIKDVRNKKQFKKYMTEFMKKCQKEISFDIDIGDDEDKRLAFTETLRQLHKNTKSKIVVKALSLDGQTYKWFTITNSQKIDTTIGHLAGTIDLNEDSSDNNPWVSNSFTPTKYQLLFIHNKKVGKQTKFTITKQNDKLFEEEIEIDEDFREQPEGGFWPYINLSEYDLTPYQIFKSVDPKNYKDNCLVYACIQSGVFTKDEIDHLRFMVKTRMIPNNLIYEIAKYFKCHFIIRRINEDCDIINQQKIKIDTRKKAWAKDYKRTVDLLLFKKHYMIYKPIQGENIMQVLRKLFAEGKFQEIKDCESNILSTNEYNHLADYEDLSYDPNCSCKLIDSKESKKPRDWSRIYYSDFETDTTQSPHRPYLNCTCYRIGKLIHKMVFQGDNIATKLLESLENNSLTYFHNLKYDACFFINTPGWDVQMIERTGTILQIVMTKYKEIEIKNKKRSMIEKRLTFRNSYSIIPAPLKSFAEMFHLDVHKEVMAYKLYTQRNIERKYVSSLEFQIQYYAEECDKKTLKEISNDWKQLIENAKACNAIKDLQIDIMAYAIYYCKLDCIVLMKGMEKFNNDLKEVFKQTNTQMNSVNDYISISSIGYNYAYKYGCFDGCYELSGKPQNFIQRCVSGGRTMTANNEKLIREGRIQDFDAVSLYPSAMSVMSGVPKGFPKILPADVSTEELLSLDQFFAEINIKSITCKSTEPYKFGQIFHRNNEGSKIFTNNPIENFYIDKRGFEDLMEFYEFDYEFVRGYYFDEGFNNKIQSFIKKLFNLRLKYKKQKNPLQSTIKLLLNSIYGKSILRATATETKCIPKAKAIKYIWKNYNYITEIVENKSIDNIYVKKIKPINNHFNLPHFGASVLSWSKHLMNRVMNTAEQNGIQIYYTDTDSLHLNESDLPVLAKIFKQKYGKELIGTQMTQFHCDFDSFEGSVGEVYSRKLIALGKKSYLDILVDEQGNEGMHIRLKGVPRQVILNKCKRMGISVEDLYQRLYNGEEITFDLLDGSNAFRKSKCYQQINLPVFERKIKF